MKIYNQEKNKLLSFKDIDLHLGYLRNDTIEVDGVTEAIKLYVPYTGEMAIRMANQYRYAQLKVELEKIKEDIEQEVFGLVRDDYAAKKARAAEIINELRVLEGKEPRAINE